MTNVKSLLEMYVKMGGSLTDTYADIAGGVPVGQYSTISDAILACSKKYSAGGGGGAEKFVVTLTQENDTWTADKTIAEIVAADEAGKNVVAFFQYMGQLPTELPKVSWMRDPEGTGSVFMFSGIIYGESEEVAFIVGQQGDSSDVWQVTFTPIPTSTNAPLIVTLAFNDPSEPTAFVGDKTYGEVFTAASAGTPCTLVLSAGGTSVATPVLSAKSSNGTITLYTYDTDSSTITSIQGSSSDSVTIAIS